MQGFRIAFPPPIGLKPGMTFLLFQAAIRVIPVSILMQTGDNDQVRFSHKQELLFIYLSKEFIR